MKNKKNILIVGVSSLVGSNLAIELKKDFNVFGTFNKNSKNLKNLKNKKNFFKVDLSLKEPFKLIKNRSFFCVIWCIHNNQIKKNIEDYYKINVLGLLKLLNFLSMKELNKFIFFSSGSLYSPSKNKIKESSKIKLNNNYKTVKFFGEKICEMYNKIYNFKLIILRPFTIYGIRQKSKLIFNLTEKIKNNKKIYIDGTKGIRLSCINVNDVSNIVKYLILNFKKNIAKYNISSPYNYSITEYCEIISNKLNKKFKLVKNSKKVLNYISSENTLIKEFKFIKFEDYVEKNL